MTTAEIIAGLPRLTPADLAQIQAKLTELIKPIHATANSKPTVTRYPRIHTPRLAHPEQSRDFIKQVVELSPDAKL